jgi:heme exporter protein D
MNWATFFDMGGRGFYVWGSFGAFMLLITIEIILVRLRIHRAQQDIRDAVIAKQIEAQSA